MARNPTAIDRLYGLDPVIEPGEDAGSDGLDPRCEISCPHCGETLCVQLDLSAGSQSYVEDCQVCCHPIQMSVRVADDGRLQSIEAG